MAITTRILWAVLVVFTYNEYISAAVVILIVSLGLYRSIIESGMERREMMIIRTKICKYKTTALLYRFYIIYFK